MSSFTLCNAEFFCQGLVRNLGLVIVFLKPINHNFSCCKYYVPSRDSILDYWLEGGGSRELGGSLLISAGRMAETVNFLVLGLKFFVLFSDLHEIKWNS